MVTDVVVTKLYYVTIEVTALETVTLPIQAEDEEEAKERAEQRISNGAFDFGSFEDPCVFAIKCEEKKP